MSNYYKSLLDDRSVMISPKEFNERYDIRRYYNRLIMHNSRSDAFDVCHHHSSPYAVTEKKDFFKVGRHSTIPKILQPKRINLPVQFLQKPSRKHQVYKYTEFRKKKKKEKNDLPNAHATTTDLETAATAATLRPR